ncbi:MAG: NUDIX hydrolase [Azonexus sp.]|nr:NUDIX hydrolase [Azonexus sp.]
MNYCPRCAASVSFIIPPGDNLPRHVCPACGYIQYQNPRLVVGCVVEHEERILLCQRAIEPRKGFWTLPAGFMENGESTAAAAIRETLEEAGARIIIDAPFAMINVTPINQVHLFYRGRLAEPGYSAGEESLAVALFAPADIPWPEISFGSVSLCLERYLADRRQGHYAFHEAELTTLVDPVSRSG